MPEDDESHRTATEQISKEFADGGRTSSFDLLDDTRRPDGIENDDDVEWVKRSDRTWHRGVAGFPFGSSIPARWGVQDGNRGSQKRKWKNSGMQWIKRNFENYDHYDDGDDSYEENGEDGSDDYDDAIQKGGYDERSKRKWNNSPMSWIKRKWGNAGMGWLKRTGDKRKWRNSNMEWVK